MAGVNVSHANTSGCSNSSLVTCDDQSDGNSHWFTAVVVLEDLMMIIGILGNVGLFALMRRKRFAQFSYSIYFSFSAVFDSFLLFINGLMDSLEVVQDVHVHSLAAQSRACKALRISHEFPQWVCPWLIVALTVDRFVSICFPNRGLWYSTRRTAILVSSGTVLLWLIVSVTLAMYEDTEVISEEDGTKTLDCRSKLTESDAGNVVLPLFAFGLPLLVILVLSVVMLCNLKTKYQYAFLSEERVSLVTEKARVERMNGVIFYVLVATFITWLPFVTVEAISLRYELHGYPSPSTDDMLDKAWRITLLFYMLPYAQNFFILLILSAMLRSECKEMIQHCCCKRRSDTSLGDNIDLADFQQQSNAEENQTGQNQYI